MKIIKSFGFAIEGIIYAIRSQLNLRIHLFGLVIMICSSFYFRFTKMELIVSILSAIMVIALELINTAIESCVDLTTEDWKPLAKVAKDCAAGGVLVSSIGAVVIWGIIVFGKLTGS
jgi:diacylglycerol kinase (ATP)